MSLADLFKAPPNQRRTLLAVDPGVRACGCALFVDGVLTRAEYVLGSKQGARAEAWLSMAEAVARWVGERVGTLVIELPQVYDRAHSKGDNNDILQLAAVVGAICKAVPSGKVDVRLPREWKGQVPKGVHHERAKKRLSAEEMACVKLPSAKSLAHNVWDGVALGLTAVDRL